MTTTTPRVLLTPEATAEALSLGRTTTYELIASGQLRSVKIGRARRVPVDALAEYVCTLVTGEERAPVLAGA